MNVPDQGLKRRFTVSRYACTESRFDRQFRVPIGMRTAGHQDYAPLVKRLYLRAQTRQLGSEE